MAGTEGAYCTPMFSPDGQSLAFFVVGAQELKKVAVQGGPQLTLTKVGGLLGATWGGDDEIIYADIEAPGLQKISSAGGRPVFITHLDASKGETGHRWPAFLPGGKAILFAIENGGNPDLAQVVARRLDTGQQRLLIQGGTYPQYVPTGHLAYVRGGRLMAVAFDSKRLEIRGQAIAASEEVQESDFGASQFGLSSQGSLVYVPPSRARRRLVWVSRDGAEQLLPARAQNYRAIRLSPDGRQLAAEIDNQIWLYDLARDTWSRFTLEGDVNTSPVWSPDGQRIAFQSNKEGPWNIFWQKADGSGGLERLTTAPFEHLPSSWSPDGRFLAFVEGNPVTRGDILILRLSDRKIETFVRTPFDEGAPAFSPDENWLAYASDESGRYEVYVRPFPGPGAKYQISTEGGSEPAWNPKGKELLYHNGDKMMLVQVATHPVFSVGKPRMLFEGQYGSSAGPPAVSPDGLRFLMHKESGAAAQINVVLNWFEELKRRVPSRT